MSLRQCLDWVNSGDPPQGRQQCSTSWYPRLHERREGTLISFHVFVSDCRYNGTSCLTFLHLLPPMMDHTLKLVIPCCFCRNTVTDLAVRRVTNTEYLVENPFQIQSQNFVLRPMYLTGFHRETRLHTQPKFSSKEKETALCGLVGRMLTHISRRVTQLFLPLAQLFLVHTHPIQSRPLGHSWAGQGTSRGVLAIHSNYGNKVNRISMHLSFKLTHKRWFRQMRSLQKDQVCMLKNNVEIPSIFLAKI